MTMLPISPPSVRPEGSKGPPQRSGSPALVAIALGLLGAAPAVSAEPPAFAYLALTDGYWEVWVANADGSAPRQVTQLGADVARATWYPDGRRLFVNAHDGRWLVVDSEKGGEPEALTAPMRGIVDAVLSPDGTRVAFSRSTGDSVDDNDIWAYRFDGAALRKLTQMPRLQHEPAWTRDGRHVYFLSGEGEQTHDIWRVEVASGGTEQLTVDSLYHFDLAVRADGALAFSSNRSGNYELWFQPVGAPAVALTDHPGLDARPDFSKDGNTLVFESSRDGEMAVYRLDLTTRTVERVSPPGIAARAPVWNPTAEATK